MTDRVPYAHAGAAQRAVLDAALELGAQLAGRDWRVLGVVIRTTSSYSRLEERMSVSYIARGARMDRADVSRSLRKLVRLGVPLVRDAPVGRNEPTVGIQNVKPLASTPTPMLADTPIPDSANVGVDANSMLAQTPTQPRRNYEKKALPPVFSTDKKPKSKNREPRRPVSTVSSEPDPPPRREPTAEELDELKRRIDYRPIDPPP